MRVRRSLPGSVIRQTLYFTDSEIERMCSEALRKGGFFPARPQAIDIENFVESYFGARLDFGTEPEKGVLGWTLFGPSAEILLVGVSSSLADDMSTVGQRRCRATVAHEAGHCLMHPILFLEDKTRSLTENLDFQQRRILCRSDDFKGGYDGRWWEVQANKAIGAFLLPKALVREAVADFLETRGSLGIETLPPEKRDAACQHVSAVFDVNLTPARIRLEGLFPPADDENFL